MVVHLCVLKEFAGLDPDDEIRFRHKLVIFTINLAGARRARGAGDGVNEFRGFTQGFHQRGFAGA